MHNPEGIIRNPGWFNPWVVGAGNGTSNGLHQLTTDTLWLIDPDAGVEGASENAIYNSLADDLWQYNDDFTEMTVKLKQGITRSDGVDFTADDVVYTVEKQKATPGTPFNGAFTAQVASVEATDPYTVHFKLNASNLRFHTLFSVRWTGARIMPKHVFEKVEDILSFDNNPPVSSGPYTLHSFDPNGTRYIWEKRADWEKTALGMVGEPKPRFIIYRNNMSPDNRLIEMRNGNLDMVHDLTPEATFSVVAQDPQIKGWFPGFPYAHPDPTLVMAIFNLQNPKFQDKRVRWALTLMLDARHVDGQLSWCGHAVGDFGAANRHPSALTITGRCRNFSPITRSTPAPARSNLTMPKSGCRSPRWFARTSATPCRATKPPSATPLAMAGGSRIFRRLKSC
ncbi:ABC transporter substrate-binding protein [Devosia sp. A8/3-2]|nr:ABC transporter substrate-binding protein [Devosia sp. A8/3-2]